MARYGGFPGARKKTRELSKAWIMSDDQQGFHPTGCLFKKIPQGVNAGVV
jgi:hypothetical protein